MVDEAMLERLKVLDRASQEQNRAALLAQREKDGHLTVKCKCGAESVMDKNRPAKAPPAKCGNCGEAL